MTDAEVERKLGVEVVRNYEALFIIKADLNEEDTNKVISAIGEIINKEGGKIEDSQIWGKRPLAYEINKQKTGTYALFHFNLEPTAISKIKRLYRLNESILRTLILTK